MRRPTIEIEPLRDEEMILCLRVLRSQLDKRAESIRLLREIEDFLFVEIPRGWRKGERNEVLGGRLAEVFTKTERSYVVAGSRGTDRKLRWTSAQKNKQWWRKEVLEELWNIQASWRSRANGPQGMMVAPQKSRPRDFDFNALSGDFRLPHFRFQKRSIAGRIQEPFMAITISSVSELFDLLLLRAIANGQLSRFAHCVVCGKWELKERAGRRSNAVIEHERECPNMADWLKGSQFWRALPRWPALCGNTVCRTRFMNVVLPKRSPFRRKDFPGLLGRGLSQTRQGQRTEISKP